MTERETRYGGGIREKEEEGRRVKHSINQHTNSN
jgi:hypothetical protein